MLQRAGASTTSADLLAHADDLAMHQIAAADSISTDGSSKAPGL
jgi:hypothetical protein